MGRKDEVWTNKSGGYIQTLSPTGYDVLINGTDRYLNFAAVSGSSGYGFRDNAGTMQFKHSGGSWAAFGSGGTSVFTSLTDVPSSYTSQALKAIRVNAGETALEFFTITGGGDAFTSAPLSQFAATTSLQLKNTISDETGSGALVFATSPTLVTPALGTPASGVATNLTGTAAGLTAGNVTTNANLTGPVTSVGNATAIADAALSIAKTSGLQAAIDLKANLASPTFTGTVTIPTGASITTPVLTGLPTGTGVASAATASTLASRDANANLSADNLLQGYTTTVTAAGTTTLTVDSTYLQFFTGSTTQTLTLPVASTLVLGQQFYIRNNSTGAVTVNSSGANVVRILAGNTRVIVTCILTSGTTAASWSVMYVGISITDGKILTASNTLTLAGTDATTMTFPTTSATVARTDAANTFTGVQTFSTPIATGSVATMSASVGGGVPTPPNNTTTFLRGDGTFATPGGSGDMVLANAQTNTGAKTFNATTLLLRNVAGTFNGSFTNTNTADRIYTLQNRAGTLSDDTDLALKANLVSPSFTTPTLGVATATRLGVGVAADASRLLLVQGDVSGGIATINRTNSSTNAVVGTATIKGTSSGDMTDGFGSAFQFAIQDNAGVENLISSIQGYRNGADNSGALGFATTLAGTATTVMTIDSRGEIIMNPYAKNAEITSGSLPKIDFSSALGTNLTTGAEAISIRFDMSGVIQRATGAVTTQRAFQAIAPTYSFVGASTITNAATFYIDGAPIAGTNATITNNYAMWVDGGTTRLDGDLGQTGNRVSKIWTTDIESTNAPLVGGVAVPTISSTNAFSNKTIIATTNVVEEITTTTSSATPTPTGGSLRNFFTVTALAAGATFAAPTGTAADGNYLTIRVKDNATARTLAWNAIYRFGTEVPAPTTTVVSKTMYFTFRYNSADTKWDCLATLGTL